VRLDDAFLSLPTLEAKQNAVAVVEDWAKQNAGLTPDTGANV